MTVRELVMLGGAGPRRRRSAAREVGARLRAALSQALGRDSATLSILAADRVVTIRGEVRSLDQISRASRVIDGFGGDLEAINLIRLRGTAVRGSTC
jgi:osmotically-inducible protein OsmY